MASCARTTWLFIRAETREIPEVLRRHAEAAAGPRDCKAVQWTRPGRPGGPLDRAEKPQRPAGEPSAEVHETV